MLFLPAYHTFDGEVTVNRTMPKRLASSTLGGATSFVKVEVPLHYSMHDSLIGHERALDRGSPHSY